MDIKKDRIEGLEEFLSKLGTVPQDKVKYYIYWVRRFLKFSNYQLENINTERVSQYLDTLEAGLLFIAGSLLRPKIRRLMPSCSCIATSCIKKWMI